MLPIAIIFKITQLECLFSESIQKKINNPWQQQNTGERNFMLEKNVQLSQLPRAKTRILICLFFSFENFLQFAFIY